MSGDTRRYAFAAVWIAAAGAVVFGMRGDLPAGGGYLVLLAAVAVVAAVYGTLPGLFATALSLLVLFPTGAAASSSVPLVLYVLMAALVCGASGALHLGRAQAERGKNVAESDRGRLAFLAQASVELDASLDYAATLNNVVRLAVPRLADWCAIYTFEEDDEARQLVAAHRDPEGEELVRALRGRFPPDAQGQHPLRRVSATGLPATASDIADSDLVAAARDPEHLQLLRDLRIRSYLCVPLHGTHGVVGAIAYVSSARERYGPPQAELAQELARRAIMAVENARLYRSAQQEITRRTQSEAELVRNQEEILQLNERLKRAMTETHHRVKNNLQIIAAMVDMLLMEEAGSVSTNDLKRLGTHIRTLAAVHDILTHEARELGEAQTISARAILEKLLPLMQETMPGRTIHTQIEDVRLPTRQGSSLALIVNELVSNAIKYGRGDVEVDLSSTGTEAELTVRDDGVGFPQGFDAAKSANTGLDLVESLSRWDLAGRTAYENAASGGARVRVAFPVGAGAVVQPDPGSARHPLSSASSAAGKRPTDVEEPVRHPVRRAET